MPPVSGSFSAPARPRRPAMGPLRLARWFRVPSWPPRQHRSRRRLVARRWSALGGIRALDLRRLEVALHLQALDGHASDDVRLEDLVHVLELHVAVPDALRVDHD